MAKRSTSRKNPAPATKARQVEFGWPKAPIPYAFKEMWADFGSDGRYWLEFKRKRPKATRADFARYYREYAERHNREARCAVRRNRTVLRRHRALFEGEGPGNRNTELFGFIGELARVAEAGNVDCANALCFMALQSQEHLCMIATRGKPWAFRMVLRLALHGVAQLNRLAEFLPDLARGFAERCSLWPLLVKPSMLEAKRDKPAAAEAREFLRGLALGSKDAFAQVNVRKGEKRHSGLGERLLAWLGKIAPIVDYCRNTESAEKWPEFLPENADTYARKFVEQMGARFRRAGTEGQSNELAGWPDDWFPPEAARDPDRRMKAIRDTLKGIFGQLERSRGAGVKFSTRLIGNPVAADGG